MKVITKHENFNFVCRLDFLRGVSVILKIFGNLGVSTIVYLGFGYFSYGSNNSFFFVIQFHLFRNFISVIMFLFYSLSFGWVVRYNLVGYNYTMRLSRKRCLLLANLGYSRHRLLIVLPNSIQIYGRKRKLYLHGINFSVLSEIGLYLLFLRDLFPYKYKGLTYMGASAKMLKPGKKTKYR